MKVENKNMNLKLNESYIIRIGNKDDLDEIEKMYNSLNEYFMNGYNYPGWLKDVYPIRETAEVGIHENNLFILIVDDKIAGSVILNNKQEEAYSEVSWGTNPADDEIIVIHTLVVEPTYMKSGIGKILMNFAKGYATKQNARTIRLDVSVNNKPAISLYEKCGYKCVGTVDLLLPYEHLKWFKLYELIL